MMLARAASAARASSGPGCPHRPHHYIVGLRALYELMTAQRAAGIDSYAYPFPIIVEREM
jgi:hypothetical protein